MKFFVLLVALLIEQAWPLRLGNPVHAAYGHFAQYLRHLLDAGQYRQGVVAWCVAVVPLTLLVLVLEWLLLRISTPLALLFGIGVLYVTVGFRMFSNYLNEINNLLKSGEVAAARDVLRRWRNQDCSELDSNAIARVAIELGLTSSHRNVFGPVAWFMVLGPAGALLYRLAALLQEQWLAHRMAESDAAAIALAPGVPGMANEFPRFAARAFEIIDWLPARLTAASFAVVGNFQDAVDCWRMQASAWADRAQGIILASGAGALGVRLGGALHEIGATDDSGHAHYRPELGAGDEADADYLSSAVGLIWRALVMWMLLAAVITLSHSLG
jgi:adenosylcobinamide-phosphate synthase